jgi:hypothetical protein
MAIGTGISFTLSDALQEADKLDNHFNKWVQQSIEINANMRKAFTSKSTGEVATGLRDLKGLIDGIAGKTISPKTNAEDVQKLGDALDRVAKAVDLLANENIELFDTKGLYDTEKSLAETSAELSTVLDKISELKNLWNEVSKWDIPSSAKNLREASGFQLTPKQAIEAARKAQEIKKQEIEDELRIEIEKKAIAQKELQWAKKTQDEKAQYIQKKLDEIFRAEQQEINKIRADYKRLNQELRNTVTSRSAIEEASQGKHMMSSEKETYDALVNYEYDLRQKIQQMENDHLEHISDLRISYAVKDAKNIADIIKKRQYSATDALTMASNARTGEEKERAKEAIKSALMTVDEDDLDTIEDLNSAYLKLRASIEKLTKAQKNEQTLQPSIRNEYRRILKELDDLHAAQERLRNTDAYKGLLSTQDAQDAADAMAAFDAREKDLLDKKVKYEQEAGNLLDEVVRENAKRQADIRLQEFEKAQKELEAREKKYGSITSFEADQVIWDNSNADNVRKSQKAIEELISARDKLNKYDIDYEKTLKNLNAEIKKHEEYIESVTDAEKYREKQAKQQRETYQGAMDYSKQAKSLNEMKEAMRALEVARNEEEVGTKKYKELERELSRITKRYKELTGSASKAHRSLWNIGEQLTRKLALVFSVSQIQGYIHKLMEVRGEFELQQRSLQAILQNKEAANEIWEKTIDLAVKSPFRVKELVTYTKQLAAYRIETDKLFETNKMLADVSAGLGVDMNRLILAYGQVRSAEYLRGTELRQFTEAGIPMLEELSKLLTETEGRAISTSDAFEMISKRMIGFAEVEEVFRRMTSEGGVFFQMQEKQADTLSGQMSNLKDSVDLMLNEIGLGMEDTLKGTVTLMRNIVENWEYLAIVIKDVAGVLVLTSFAKFAKGLFASAEAVDDFIDSGKRLVSMGARMQKSILSLVETIATNPWIALGVALASIVVVLGQVARAANKTKRALAEIASQGSFDASKSIAEYKRLANIVTDTSKTYEEQKKALSTLQKKYEDILPEQYLQAKSIQELKDNYDEATAAIYEYIAAKTKEKQIEKIEETYGEKVNDAYANFAEVLRKRLAAIAGTKVALSDVTPIVDRMREGFENGAITLENYHVALMRLIKEHSGLDVNVWNDYRDVLATTSSDFLFSIGNMNEAIMELNEGGLEWGSLKLSLDAKTKPIYDEFNAMREEANKTKDSFSALLSRLNDIGKKDAQGNAILSEETYNETIKTLNKMYSEIGLNEVEWSEIINDPFKLKKATIDYNVALWGDMITKINSKELKYEGEFAARDNFIQSLEKEMERFKGTDFQQEINRILIDLSKGMNVSLTGLGSLFATAEQSVSDYAREVERTLQRLKTSVAEYDNDVARGVNFSPIDPTQIDHMREQIPLVEQFLKLFEVYLDKSKQDKGTDTFSPKLRVIKEMYSEYKKLSDLFDDITAKEGAMAKFGDAFKEAFDKTPEQMGFDLFSEEGVKAAYDYLISKAPDAKKKIQAQLAKGEIVWDVKLQTKKDEDKKLLDSIQELFDRYDLSLELKKLNIPPDLAKSLFNVDYLGLEGLKKAVEDQKEAFVGKGMLDEYDDLMKKIGELSRKRQEEEAKEFINFLKKTLDEVKLIQDKGAYNIALADRLFGEGKISAEQYMSSIRQIVEDTNKEVAKVNLDKFKDSATYIKAMGNLAAYSRNELEGMISALQGQVGANAGNMGTDEIRAYYEALERLVDQYDKLESPFQKGEINDLIEYLNLQKELNKEKEKESALEQKKSEINNRLNLLQAQLKSQQERGDVLGAASTQRQIKSAVGELKEVDGELVSVTSNISVISEKVANLGDGMVKGLVVAQKVVNEIANIANASTKMFDDIKSAADALGADTESGGWAKAGYAMEMVGGVSSELTSGLSNLASGNFAGALANVVGMVTKLISGFAKIHDQNYQDIIEAQAEAVERLGKAYEKLETATESAYSIQQLQQYNEELERNIELQIASYKAMIAAEHAKKNTDEEQIEAWNEELEALTEQWEELKASLLEGVGGVSKDNYRSQTREFVDAWVSAFKETGNGLQGLKDNFREFFDNIIAEHAAMRVTEKYLEPFYASLNEALNDYELTAKESKDLREMVEKIAPDLSSALEKIWGQLGGSLGEEDGAGLSSLQKGISGMSEEQAEILTAYWNSVRGYTASIDSKMDLILANMGVGTENNPMLEQLISQTGWLSKIHGILEDVASASPRAFKTALM